MTPREKELVRRAMWHRMAALPPDLRDQLWRIEARHFIRYVKDQMHLWRARETAFPARARRPEPDDMDIATGTWPIRIEPTPRPTGKGAGT